MANERLGLTELIKLNDMNLADVEMTDLLQKAPFLAALHAETASNGTKHSYLVEDGAPAVGFRTLNNGRDTKKSSDRTVEIALQILAATFDCDQQTAKNYSKAKGGEAAWMAREAKRHLRAAFAAAEKQIFYGTGTGGDADGFVGLSAAATVDSISDTDHVVNAGGTTVNGAMSVWAVCTNAEGTDVQVIMGQDGEITIQEYFAQMLVGENSKLYPAFVQPIEGYLGLQVGSAYSLARIVNLTAQENCGLTDRLLAELVEKFPDDKKSELLLVMPRRARTQWKNSRTATTDTGRDAPTPTEYEGIPVITTDQLLKTEPIVA